jgi:hypothetical protein
MFYVQLLWDGVLLGYLTQIDGSLEYGPRHQAIAFRGEPDCLARRLATAIELVWPGTGFTLFVTPALDRGARRAA